MMNKFWKNKKVFLTGHTGFKGSWLSIILEQMGAVIKGYSLIPAYNPNLFSQANIESFVDSEIGDIRNRKKLESSIYEFSPDILIHMAAQPLVRYSYENPYETYSTNVIGTLNVLESARLCKNLRSIIIITTDKCYENKELNYSYKETDSLGGYDPYSSSKACCELLVSSYRQSFFSSDLSAGIASVRAGNVIGGGDWSIDRLIPDVIKSFDNQRSLEIRNPKAIRPWQHVFEPLFGYIKLAEKLFYDKSYNGAWNFGPRAEDCKSVDWVVEKLMTLFENKSKWNYDRNDQPHESGILKLDFSKAKELLKWEPVWNLDKGLKMVVDWHKSFNRRENMKEKCLTQINQYINDLNYIK